MRPEFFEKPLGAVNIPFPVYLETNLKKYIENPTEETLYAISPVEVAHTIDVIFKNCERLYNEVYCKLTDPIERAMCTLSTPYDLFDKKKVFFGKDITWNIPFSVEPENHGSDFKRHNYFYFKGYEGLDENGLLSNFYQDLDIMATPDNWKMELLKALYRVVFGAYSSWKTWHITHNE